MRSKFVGYVIVLTVGLALSSLVSAQPKKNKGADSGGDRSMDKQMDWEKKVMGDDSTKRSEMKKIAAAQRLAEEAAKNPPPIQGPKVKDPNKEGVRAKQEAAIGLPIASDQDAHGNKKNSAGGAKKAVVPPSSANDELGALVATSLAEEKSSDSNAVGRSRTRTKGGSNGGAKGRARAKSGGAPSSLDQMFATSGK
jgi:hypothetical protein